MNAEMTLDELRRLSDAATPGEWLRAERRGKRDGYVRTRTTTVADLRYRNGENDAAFIVAAVAYVRSILQEQPR